jgi:transketolase
MSHHATEDLAILRALPGLIVVAPGDNWETANAVAALADIPGTTYLRLDKSSAGWTGRHRETFTIGKARRLREGDALTIVATGGILGLALSAADRLRQEGVEVRLLSMHTIKPIDVEALFEAARETGGILSVEEHTIHGGLGGAIAETLMEAGVIPRAFFRVGLRDGFSVAVGSQEYLRRI